MMLLHGAWLKEEVPGATPCLFLWGELPDSGQSAAVPAPVLRQTLAGLSRELGYLGLLTQAVVCLPCPWKVAGYYFPPQEAMSVFHRLRAACGSQAALLLHEDYLFWNNVYEATTRCGGEASPGPAAEWERDMPDSAYRVFQYGGPRPGGTLPLGVTPQKGDWLRSFIAAMRGAVIGAVLQRGGSPQVFRTSLRLEEPALAGEDWQLTYWLHPAEDPSLLMSAADIREATGSAAIYFQQQAPALWSQLLRDLSIAARVCLPIADSLQETYPVACRLSERETQSFLAGQAENIREAGIGVSIPNWWRKAPVEIGVRLLLEEVATGPGFLGVAALASFRLEVALGDQPVDRDELERMVALKTSVVRLAGQWRQIDPESARAALLLLDRHAGKPIQLGKLIEVLAAGDTGQLDPESPVALPIVEFAAPDRLQALFSSLQELAAPPELLPAPPGFQGVLRPYQARGVAWLIRLAKLGLGACLADDMGLGKTIQVIAYLLEKRGQDPAALPALIVCPLSVVENWRRELAGFAPRLRVVLHHGVDRLRGKRFAEMAAGQEVVLTTYALAQRDNAELLAVRWGDIILDEAQNIKNPFGGQASGILRLTAPCRLALTGTPVENRLRELWSIMQFLNPGYLPTLPEFEQNYSLPIERLGDAQQQRRLQRLIQPFLLRRLKTDKTIAPDLPEKQETKVYCPLTREQATLYAAVLDVMLPQIDEASNFSRKALIRSTLTQLKQICNHPAHFLKDGSAMPHRSGKLTRLVEMLSELKAGGRRALIFTQYAQMGHLLQRYLRQVFGAPVFFLHGALAKGERDRLVTDFQHSEQAPSFFILSLKAGGVGLNLTRADTVFHYDRWWNPAVENQATDRAYRIGQTRNVQVYKFIATATLEEKIDDMIEAKQKLADGVIGSGEAWLSELSTADLGEFLRLRAGA